MSGFAEFVPVAMAVASQVLKQQTQQQQVKAQNRAAEAAAQAQMDQIRQAQEIENRRRSQALAVEMASQRARFGASGISTAGGSAEAVLLGLQTRADQESADSDSIYDTRYQNISSQLQSARERNLLSLADGWNRTALGIGGILRK